MARQTTYEGLMARYMAGYGRTTPIMGEQVAATTATVLAGPNGTYSILRAGVTKAFPSLPTGVSGYIVTRAYIASTQTGTVFLCRLVDLGSFNNGTNTWTDGNAMPTVTELGTSRTMAGAVFVEVEVATNSNAGSLTITYVDQDGNAAESTTARTMTNSATVGSFGLLTLNTGDCAVRDITNVTRSGGASHAGTIRFWGMVPVAMLTMGSVIGGEAVDLLTTRFHYHLFGAGEQLTVLQGNISAANTRAIGFVSVVGDST